MMRAQQLVADWLKELGIRIAGSPWVLSDEGVATFEFDQLELVIEIEPSDSSVGLYVDLGVAPAENDPTLWLAILTANSLVIRLDVATLSVHPTTQNVTLGYVLPVDWLDASSLGGFVSSLMDQAIHWRTKLEKFHSGFRSEGNSHTQAEPVGSSPSINDQFGLYV